jgi:hypothetical protein
MYLVMVLILLVMPSHSHTTNGRTTSSGLLRNNIARGTNRLGISEMAGRPPGSPNVRNDKPFSEALRIELAAAAAAGNDHRTLRHIARNLISHALSNEPTALSAISQIADRLDGKPRQEAEVTFRTAVARELTDDDLAAIAVGASRADQELNQDTTNVVPIPRKPDPSELN